MLDLCKTYIRLNKAKEKIEENLWVTERQSDI